MERADVTQKLRTLAAEMDAFQGAVRHSIRVVQEDANATKITWPAVAAMALMLATALFAMAMHQSDIVYLLVGGALILVPSPIRIRRH